MGSLDLLECCAYRIKAMECCRKAADFESVARACEPCGVVPIRCVDMCQAHHRICSCSCNHPRKRVYMLMFEGGDWWWCSQTSTTLENEQCARVRGWWRVVAVANRGW